MSSWFCTLYLYESKVAIFVHTTLLGLTCHLCRWTRRTLCSCILFICLPLCFCYPSLLPKYISDLSIFDFSCCFSARTVRLYVSWCNWFVTPLLFATLPRCCLLDATQCHLDFCICDDAILKSVGGIPTLVKMLGNTLSQVLVWNRHDFISWRPYCFTSYAAICEVLFWEFYFAFMSLYPYYL